VADAVDLHSPCFSSETATTVTNEAHEADCICTPDDPLGPVGGADTDEFLAAALLVTFRSTPTRVGIALLGLTLGGERDEGILELDAIGIPVFVFPPEEVPACSCISVGVITVSLFPQRRPRPRRRWL
jgi:hypothetical protein